MARILYKNDTIQNETLFHTFTTAVFENRHIRTGTTKQWTFPGAFYFSTLVVTLIGELSSFFCSRISFEIQVSSSGYGHTTPKTSKFSFKKYSKTTFDLSAGGKIFCMVYTVAGV